MKMQFCTIATNSHLAQSVLLAQSIRKSIADSEVYLLLVDNRVEELTGTYQLFDQVFTLEDLNIKNLKELAFKFTTMEFTCLLKPFLLRFLLNKKKLDSVIYLDSDILVFSPFPELVEQMKQYSVVLSPHCLTPNDDPKYYQDLNLLSRGVFNLGFIAIRKTEESLALLDWWAERLSQYCYYDINNSFFYDQNWLTLAQHFFKNVGYLSHPGYNVAFFNMHERNLSFNDKWKINKDYELRFFHFAGYRLASPKLITFYRPELKFENWPNSQQIFLEYEKLLSKALENTTKFTSCRFQCFANGSVIAPQVRKMYANWLKTGKIKIEDPFISSYSNPIYLFSRKFLFLSWLYENLGTRMIRSTYRNMRKIFFQRLTYG